MRPTFFPREMRRLTTIPRWAIFPCIKPQTVAEHCFLVAVYAHTINAWLQKQGYEVDYANFYHTLSYALFHDADEILSGDVTPPAKAEMKKAAGESWAGYERWVDAEMGKRFNFECHAPNDKSKAVVKLADLLEAIMYTKSEEFMGNKNFMYVQQQLMNRLYKSVQKVSEVFKLDSLDEKELHMKIRMDIESYSAPDMLVGDLNAAF